MTIVRTMSTLQANIAGRRRVAQLDAALSDASKEATTGLKADPYRSLGLRAAETSELRARRARIEGFVASNTMLANRLVVTAQAMGAIREVAQDFLTKAVSSRDSLTQTAEHLQKEARVALSEMTALINTSFAGAHLFSGTTADRAPLQNWDAANAVTGFSPEDIVSAVIGGGITDAADAAQKAADLQAIYGGSYAANTDWNFEASFYNGTPLADGAGNPNERLSARIEEGVVVEYGIQANDPAFTEVLRGIAMIAGVNVTAISDPDAYSTWMGGAVDAVAAGIDGLSEAEFQLGKQQQLVDRTLDRQQRQFDLYSNRVLALEGVDAFEAASRVNLLQAQLEATYAVTARLSKLTLLNYI